MQELKPALRTLLRAPGFTLASVACLACGVGVTTTILSALIAILLRPFPYAHAAQPQRESGYEPLSREEFEAFRDRTRTGAGLATWLSRAHELSGPEGLNERADGAVITPNLFDVLGVDPQLGSPLTPASGEPQVLLGHALWQRRYGGESTIVGRRIQIFGRPHVVTGVMPPGVTLPEGAEVWTTLNPREEAPGVRRYAAGALGRLGPGASRLQAQAEMAAIARSLPTGAEPFPERREMVAIPLRRELMGSLRRPVFLFQAAALLVLLIACANVANLMLARATAQQREVAIRLALGAGKRRLLEPLIAQSAIVAAGGGVLGAALAFYGVRLLKLAFPDGVPSYIQIAIDPLVLIVTLGLSLMTAIAFAIMPALRFLRVNANAVLTSGRETHAALRLSTRQVLVVFEVALSFVLIVGATLLVRSDAGLEREVRFDADRVLSVRVRLPYPIYEGARRDAFYARVFERIRSLPGVEAVGSTTLGAPLALPALRRLAYQPGGRPDLVGGDPPTAAVREVSADYLHALGVPLIRGRAFTAADARGGSSGDHQRRAGASAFQ
jgi:predicted permease